MHRNKRYPLRHLSIRVPWHDHGWDGTVCQVPKANGACLVLKNCSLKRDGEAEAQVAGREIRELPRSEFPVCVDERGTFMAAWQLELCKNHPYHETCSEHYGHFQETTIRLPPYSAPAVPFYWMLRENARGREADRWNAAKEGLIERYNLDYDHSREPSLDFDTDWVQEAGNQRALCDCFFEHLEPQASLCFFYAKQVPFVEEAGRVLVGVGRVLHVADGVEYRSSSPSGMRTMLWEHPVQHSIRPDFGDGYLLPYHAALAYAEQHGDFDPSSLAVIVPAEKQFEFSYASEHVTCDTAIEVLLRCVTALRAAEGSRIGSASWQNQIQWCHDRINELEHIRGSYPGLGSALCAFGLRKGHFIAREIAEQLGEDEDPWPLVERMFEDPGGVLSTELAVEVKRKRATKFRILKEAKPTKYALLRMLSRFEINQDQAKLIYRDDEYAAHGIEEDSDGFLRNPYLLYEVTRHHPDLAIPLSAVEMGVFRGDSVQAFPSTDPEIELDDETNGLRVRGLAVQELEKAAGAGHTLLPLSELVRRIRDLPLRPPCELDTEDVEVADEEFGLALRKADMADGQIAYQLGELADDAILIRSTIAELARGAHLPVSADWRRLVDRAIDPHGQAGTELSPDDERARAEKAAALQELGQSRFCVLIGPAGTGKTTLVDALCAIPEVRRGGVLLLAPTGKARVRLEQVAQEANSRAQTLAQFLLEYERFDVGSQRYIRRPGARQCQDAETIIVDESSMLTEPMLAALLDSLKGVKRIILVGDHRQLPPIGPGRPFFDIVRHLAPEDVETRVTRVGPCYCELTVKMRQGGSDREDLQLAEWFSGNPLPPGEDDIFGRLTGDFESECLRVVCWQDEAEFADRLGQVLSQELGLGSIDNVQRFDESLGAEVGANGRARFNWRTAAERIEDWQLMCPIRNRPIGVNALNRRIHELFRARQVEYVQGGQNSLPRPFGPQCVVYGDKVINNRNMRRSKKYVSPGGGLNYIANGEIGIVVGRCRRKNEAPKRPTQLEVEFSSQVGFRYLFGGREFKEEGDIPLELAYAITVHKSQGSQFRTVLLVVPQPCFLLKREMLYTALTRQEDRVVLLFQGHPRDLRKYAAPKYSDTAQRITNLLAAPHWIEVEGRFFEDGLIHRASDHEMLRSKSEVIIYERLLGLGLKPAYEKALVLEGQEKYPDFTLEFSRTGVTAYWEHCGMLQDEAYRRRWQRKRDWYVRNGVVPLEEATDQDRILIVSRDSESGAISIPAIDALVGRITEYRTA